MTHWTERRRVPRVVLVGQVKGDLVPMDVPIVVREISLGGMSIETEKPFDVERRLVFQLTLGDGADVLVPGKVVYCDTAQRESGPGFVTGIQFIDEDPVHPADVSDLIKKIH